MYVSKLNPAVYTKCPFYQSEFKKSITCEGISDGSLNTMKFKDEDSKNDYLLENCFRYPNDCPIAVALGIKYGEE